MSALKFDHSYLEKLFVPLEFKEFFSEFLQLDSCLINYRAAPWREERGE
jgi:hypothetical protein